MKLNKEHEEKIYSQFGEDGIIRKIFDIIGIINQRFIEIGIEDGKECNTRNLVENENWSGFMIEGNKRESKRAIKLYSKYPVGIINDMVNLDNINKYINHNLDLLSIDIDGSDFWIWEKIKLRPRVIIIEYNSTFFDKSITIPYSNNPRKEKHPDWLYHGAGLNALIKLGNKKGYKLVYANGTNAFFIRRDIKEISELSFEEAYKENLGRRKWGSPEEQFSLIKNRRFIEI
jgi:hypothetical protein